MTPLNFTKIKMFPNLKILQWLSIISLFFNEETIEELRILLLEMPKYYITYNILFKGFKQKDIVIIQYTGWKKKEYLSEPFKRPMLIQTTKSLSQIRDMENGYMEYDYRKFNQKELNQNEEILGIVLKSWNGTFKDHANLHIVKSQKYNGLAILGGETIYVITNVDWLNGIEVVSPETELPKILFNKAKNFILNFRHRKNQ